MFCVACTVRTWVKSPTPATYPAIGALPADSTAQAIWRFVRANRDARRKALGSDVLSGCEALAEEILAH